MTEVVTAVDGVKLVEPRVQVVPIDGVVQVRVTGAAKPARGEVRMEAEIGSPAMTLPEVGVRASVKSTPLPVSELMVLE